MDVFDSARVFRVAAPMLSVRTPLVGEAVGEVNVESAPARQRKLIVAPRPHITLIIDVSTYVATHGSPWNYDRRVPVLFYQPRIVGFEQALPIETVDILPILAALIELPVPPAEIDGRCIDLAVGAGDTCAPIGR